MGKPTSLTPCCPYLPVCLTRAACLLLPAAGAGPDRDPHVQPLCRLHDRHPADAAVLAVDQQVGGAVLAMDQQVGGACHSLACLGGHAVPLHVHGCRHGLGALNMPVCASA